MITDVLFLWPEDSSGYYAGSKYEQGNGYYVARYRQPSYYPYGYFGGFYSPFYYPYHFGGFGHGFYGFHGFRGFYNGGSTSAGSAAAWPSRHQPPLHSTTPTTSAAVIASR